MAITNGLERPYEGSVPELVALAKSITLLTRHGAEVQMSASRELKDGWWEGQVVRAASSSDAPAIGTWLSFHLSHVLGGTL
jgi:hypothetical protein